MHRTLPTAARRPRFRAKIAVCNAIIGCARRSSRSDAIGRTRRRVVRHRLSRGRAIDAQPPARPAAVRTTDQRIGRHGAAPDTMTGLFGTFAETAAPDARNASNDAAGTAGPVARVHTSAHGFMAVEPGAIPAAVYAEGGITVGVYGLPSAEGTTRAVAGPIDQAAHRLLHDYRRRGTQVLDELVGHCCVAIWDEARRRLVLAVDRLGVEQMFVARARNGIAFATSVELLAPLSATAPSVSRQALFDYFYFHVVPSPISIYEGIERLGPGECLTWQDGRIERTRYWQAEFQEAHERPFEELQREFVAALEASVADAVAGARCGAFLSGGTDSSTIAGFMRRCGGDVTDTYSIGFEAEGYDEMAYARTAARHFGTVHHEYYVTPDDVVDAIPGLARIHDQPFGNSSAVPAYYCARQAAADGIQRMIGGDGGDELFGGNARYATQSVFSLYERIPALLRSRVIEPAARRLPAAIPPLRKVRSYVEQASVPMPERTETYNLLRRLGHRSVFRDELLEQVDPMQPSTLQSQAYFNPTARSLINRQLAMDMKFTLADNDLRKVIRSCELAGLPVAFPMLDHRVVDFSLKLAPHLKLRGTTLRYFFKRALAGFLPDEIIRKPKHGFGLPFGPWAVTHPRLRAFAFDSISDLAGRGIFRRELLDRVPDQLREHPGYYGSLAWVLMMLEQWFKHHAPATRFS
jgi:asparagine synthase (glutamine-hydrolysing)